MKNCKQCGTNISHLKSNALFCGANCRVNFANSRKRNLQNGEQEDDQEDEQNLSVMERLEQLEEQIFILKTGYDDIKALLEIQKTINVADDTCLIRSNVIAEILTILSQENDQISNCCEIERDLYDFDITD